MADRKPFLLRIDRDVLDSLQRWANDDLRSLNGQIEFVLRRALEGAGRAERAGKAGKAGKPGGSGGSGGSASLSPGGEGED